MKIFLLLLIVVSCSAQACPPHCFAGYCNSSGICGSCSGAWWGSTCSNPCPAHCWTGQCAMTTGLCDSCSGDWWGPTCSNPCPIHCWTGQCNFKTGLCDSCSGNWWGPTCSNPCPANCWTGQCSSKTGYCGSCRQSNQVMPYCEPCGGPHCTSCNSAIGVCQQCEAGYYGYQCQGCSPNCANGCDNNGACVGGCSNPAYRGSQCREVGPLCDGCTQLATKLFDGLAEPAHYVLSEMCYGVAGAFLDDCLAAAAVSGFETFGMGGIFGSLACVGLSWSINKTCNYYAPQDLDKHIDELASGVCNLLRACDPESLPGPSSSSLSSNNLRSLTPPSLTSDFVVNMTRTVMYLNTSSILNFSPANNGTEMTTVLLSALSTQQSYSQWYDNFNVSHTRIQRCNEQGGLLYIIDGGSCTSVTGSGCGVYGNYLDSILYLIFNETVQLKPTYQVVQKNNISCNWWTYSDNSNYTVFNYYDDVNTRFPVAIETYTGFLAVEIDFSDFQFVYPNSSTIYSPNSTLFYDIPSTCKPVTGVAHRAQAIVINE